MTGAAWDGCVHALMPDPGPVELIEVLRAAAEALTRAAMHAPTVTEVFELGAVARRCLDAVDVLKSTTSRS